MKLIFTVSLLSKNSFYFQFMEPVLTVEFTGEKRNGLFAKWTDLIRGNMVKKHNIRFTSSSNHLMRAAHHIFEKDWDDCALSTGKKNAYLQLDFKKRRIILTQYSLRTGPFPLNVNHLKSWTLSASNDGTNFVDLDVQKDSKAMNKYLSEFISNKITLPDKDGYRYYRLTQTGKNWSGKNRFGINHIEFFGTVTGKPIKDKYVELIMKDFSEKDKEELRNLFNKIDKDGNGQLDEDELKQFFKTSFPLPQKMVPIAFKICDKNNDGSINFDEFFNFFGNLIKLRSDDPVPSYHMLFDAIDSGNHSLNLEEIVDFCSYAQKPITESEARQLIQQYDSDNDMRLTFDEIYKAFLDPNAKGLKSYLPAAFQEQSIEKLRETFNSIDEDGNGELDREEFLKFCHNQNEVDLVFLLSDTDRSNTISFDEYLAFNKSMVEASQDASIYYKKIFDALDEQHAGSLDESKLKEFYRLADIYPNTSFHDFIQSKDSDKDGRLTFEEATNFE